MNIEFLPNGVLTMSEVVTTATFLLSGVAALYGWAVRQAQSEKDRQIKARDATIAYLESELKKLRDEKKAIP